MNIVKNYIFTKNCYPNLWTEIIIEKQIAAECKKSRHISLNQIEIKMVDEKEEKGLAQFMYEGIDT